MLIIVILIFFFFFKKSNNFYLILQNPKIKRHILYIKKFINLCIIN